jgi:uncharacterized protein (TIGR01777 family)
MANALADFVIRSREDRTVAVASKIVIAGGSGHLGTLLTRAFRARGDEVVVLSRAPGEEPWKVVKWDGRSLGRWATEIDGADAVINLAGRSVDCRYSARNRAEIRQSRIESTRVIGEAIALASRPPRVWLQMSTATIYAHRFDAPNDECSGIIGNGEPWRFSVEVARAWEKALDDAAAPDTRKVKLRTAMVMSAHPGGAFPALLRHVRYGLGRMGSGRQYVSWVHEQDFVHAVAWLLAHDEIEGVVNIAAPSPLPAADFLEALGDAWGSRLRIPVPRWLIEIGTFVLRTESELVLKSRRVVPKRLSDAGFPFLFPNWPRAARDLCERTRGGAVRY